MKLRLIQLKDDPRGAPLIVTSFGPHFGTVTLLLQTVSRAAAASRLRLCARYWHFLLLWWLLLFGLLFLLRPELARAICGTA